MSLSAYSVDENRASLESMAADHDHMHFSYASDKISNATAEHTLAERAALDRARGGSSLSCPECSMTFSRADVRDRHVQSTHKHGKKFWCPIIGCPRNEHFQTDFSNSHSTSERGKGPFFRMDKLNDHLKKVHKSASNDIHSVNRLNSRYTTTRVDDRGLTSAITMEDNMKPVDMADSMGVACNTGLAGLADNIDLAGIAGTTDTMGLPGTVGAVDNMSLADIAGTTDDMDPAGNMNFIDMAGNMSYSNMVGTMDIAENVGFTDMVDILGMAGNTSMADDMSYITGDTNYIDVADTGAIADNVGFEDMDITGATHDNEF